MRISKLVKSLATIALVYSTSAAQAVILLESQYSVTSFASGLGANTWQFNYTVTNNDQEVGGFTGLDGFTIFIPESATVLASTSPASYNGAPGYWSNSTGSGLLLNGNGLSNLYAPSGFNSFTWWGSDPTSVYTVGSTAVFSVTLGNVVVGLNTVGVTSYFGNAIPSQEYSTIQGGGNYSTFVGNFTSPVSAVPEPESYAILLAGLGIVSVVVRRRQRKV